MILSCGRKIIQREKEKSLHNNNYYNGGGGGGLGTRALLEL